MPYGDSCLNIPESDDGRPDILNEARYNMEFMLKMQVPNDHQYEGMVHEDIYQEPTLNILGLDRAPYRELNPPTTKATLNLAATAAQTARIWKDYDEHFAEKCLEAAKKAYNAAKKYSKIFSENNKDTDLSDEFYWAACELYASTGEEDYLNDVRENKNYLNIPTVLKEYDGSEISGCYDTTNVQALGTLSLLSSETALIDSDMVILRDNITKAADEFIKNQKFEGYGTTIKQGVFADGERGYQLNSNVYVANSIILLCYADMINSVKNSKYLDSATEAMNYLLGNNANSKSYVSGYVEESVQDPYDKFFANAKAESFPKAPNGILVSGPNSQTEDEYTKSIGLKRNSVFPAKRYVDNYEASATNASNLEGNAALSWAATYLDFAHRGIWYPTPDLNDDGKVDIADYTLLKSYINGKDVKINLNNADLNRDGKVNFLDLLALRNIL